MIDQFISINILIIGRKLKLSVIEEKKDYLFTKYKFYLYDYTALQSDKLVHFMKLIQPNFKLTGKNWIPIHTH